MQRYRDFAPTGFDARGAFLEDRQDWLVLPVSQTRDSGELDQSNFAAALAICGGESDEVEVHRFGHWGPGWFEVILVRPDSPAADMAEQVETRLQDYPVLDEKDLSRREAEAYASAWEGYGRLDFVRKLEADFGLLGSHTNCPYTHDSSGVCIALSAFDCSRDELARFLRQHK